jgi:predicted esterase
MLRLSSFLSVLILAGVPLDAPAQSKKRLDHIVIYKDGFFLKGKVGEKVGEVIYDSKTGQSFPIPSGEFFLNDYARTIYFGHNQIQKVIPLEANASKPIVRFNWATQSKGILKEFVFESFSRWNNMGERTVRIDNQTKGRGGYFDMTQKVWVITPQYIKVVTIGYEWELVYLTQEFGPELTRSIVLQAFRELKEYKEMTDAQKYLELAKFMQEAGWFDDAERELNDTKANYPNAKKIVEERLTNLKQIRANLFVEGLQQASNVGQHQIALDRLTIYDKEDYDKLVSQRHRLIVNDLKADYEKAKARIAEAKRYLKVLPPETKNVAAWTNACTFIADELNLDTIGLQKGRLDLFLDFAKQHELDLKNRRKPGQSAEEVLALAVTGWLQGNQAAEPDPKMALTLIRAREFVLDYLRTDARFKRDSLLSEFKRDNNLPVDVMARLVRMIPPSHPYDLKGVGSKVQSVPIEAPENNGGNYLLQLPPDYQPLRSYPVLMVFHSGREKPGETLTRFSEDAAKHGFILVAPLWAGDKPFKSEYKYSYKEHALVLDTLRDLRRRFQIDSDRVFLFGWEAGANLVYDIGLAHPDLFAGIAPMNGVLQPFARRFYHCNSQYLPTYIIDGDRNGNAPKANRDLLKDWLREPYNCTYVEYHGRGSEWFGAEVPNILNWMSRKKRHTPMKELGRAGNAGQLGEEFRSTRMTDDHFYWLSGEGFGERYLRDDHRGFFNQYFKPATLQASLSSGNLLVKGEAKNWYQVNVRATGLKQVTLWITPNMMDLPNPLTVRVNGEERISKRMIQPSLDVMLEELYRSGDRQRLYVAKVVLSY